MVRIILTQTSYRPRGRAIGWGISLVAHALLVAGLIFMHTTPAVQAPAPARIVFVLVPQRAVPRVVTPAPPAPLVAAASARNAASPAGPAAPHAALVQAKPTEAPAHTDVITALPTVDSDTAIAAPPAAPPATPAFDMAAARATARQSARDGSGDLVTRPRLPPTLDPGREAREEKLAAGIERSTRRDCKTAYAGAGLLAIIPLVKDAVTGTGCKW